MDAIRSGRERLIQTLCFETLGVIVVTPLLALVMHAPAGESLLVLAALSLSVMCWSALFNTAFDRVEYRLAGRAASDRPHGFRVLHAVGHEATSVVVTWPLIVALTPLDWTGALVADVGLTVTYAVYGYFFHLGFDRWRPVRTGAAALTSSCSRTARPGHTPSPA